MRFRSLTPTDPDRTDDGDLLGLMAFLIGGVLFVVGPVVTVVSVTHRRPG